MIEYNLFLPLLRKYKGKTLIRKLCRIERCFMPKGYFWVQRIWHVERDYFGKKYIQLYGGSSMVEESMALKADEIKVVKYVGKSELTVVLHYHVNNPLTGEFINRGCIA